MIISYCIHIFMNLAYFVFVTLKILVNNPDRSWSQQTKVKKICTLHKNYQEPTNYRDLIILGNLQEIIYPGSCLWDNSLIKSTSQRHESWKLKISLILEMLTWSWKNVKMTKMLVTDKEAQRQWGEWKLDKRKDPRHLALVSRI